MPEGDTIYRTAVQLRKALLDRPLLRFETSVAQVQAAAARLDLDGRSISAVEPRGKHLLITLAQAGAEPLVLHTHMRMTGAWHLYRPGERWQRPAHLAVVTLYTDAFVAPCFSAPVVELLTAAQAARHPELLRLGPDAVREDFDLEEALRRLRSRGALPLGVALLNQRVLAGVGNVYKSEVLFLRRLSPLLTVDQVAEQELRALLRACQELLLRNRDGAQRRTRDGLDRREPLWVYGRSGAPCAVCGAIIRMTRQGEEGRSTYYCPRCQGVSAGAAGGVNRC